MANLFKPLTEDDIMRQRTAFAAAPSLLHSDAVMGFETAAEDFGWTDSFAAGFEREALTLSFFNTYGPDALKEQSGDREPVNQYLWLKKNLSDEDKGRYDLWIGRGVFDDTKTPFEIKTRLAQLKYELDRTERADASLFGDITGSLVGALADPLTIVPFFGMVAKGRIALRGFGFAAKAARANMAAGGRLKALQAAAAAEKAQTATVMAQAKVLGVRTGLYGSRKAAVGAHMSAAAFVEIGREIGLHDDQITRTLQESLMNVGFAGLLGAGLGAFARVKSPRSPLNPENPKSVQPHLDPNQAHLYNDGLGASTADSGMDHIPATREAEALDPEAAEFLGSIEKDMARYKEGSAQWEAAKQKAIDYLDSRGHSAGIVKGGSHAGDLGAAAPRDWSTSISEELAEGLFSRIPGVKQFVKLARVNRGTGTPIGRFAYASSDKARGIYIRLMDRGGTLSKAEQEGHVHGFSAEDISGMLHHNFYQRQMLDQHLGRSKIDKKIADLAEQGKWGDTLAKKVSDSDWNDIMQRYLHTFLSKDGVPYSLWDIDDALKDAFGQKYGPVLGDMINEAKKFSKATFAIRENMMGQLKARGIIKDEGLIKELAARSKAIKKENKGLRSEVNKNRSAEGETDSAELLARISENNKMRSDLEARIRREKGKVDDLGGEYGTAQLWNTNAILTDVEAFRGWFRELMKRKVDGDWLQKEWGIDPDILDDLGVRVIDADDLADSAVDSLNIKGVETGQNIINDAGQITVEAGERLRKAIDEEWYGIPGDEVATAKQAEVFSAWAAHDNVTQELHQLNRDMGMAGKREKVDLKHATDKAEKLNERIARLEDKANEATKQAEDAAKRIGDAQEGLDDLPGFDPQDPFPLGKSLQQTAADPADFASRSRGVDPSQRNPFEANEGEALQKHLLKQKERYEKRVRDAAEAREKMHQTFEGLVEYENLLQRLEAAAGRLQAAGETLSTAEAKLTKFYKSGGHKRAAVDDVIDNMIRDITKGDTGRMASYMEEAAGDDVLEKTAARLKHRTIRLDGHQRLSAIKAGWLRSDLDSLLYTESRQLAGTLGMADALHLGDVSRGFDGSFSEVVKVAEDDYAQKILNADVKEAHRLQNEWKLIKRDFNVLRDRLMGNLHPKTDSNHIVQWFGKRFREVNFSRYVPGFLSASFTDLATTHMVTSGMGGHLLSHAKDSMDLLLSLRKHDDWIAHLAASTEVMTQFNLTSGRAMRLASLDDNGINKNLGFGAEGTLTNTISHAIAQGTGAGVDIMNKASGMPYWNGTWKIMVGLHMSKQVREMATIGWDKLSKTQRAHWAGLGVHDGLAQDVLRLANKYGDKGKNPLDRSDLGIDRWADEGIEGARTANKFKMALNRAMTRAIISPGIGDTPVMMEHWFAKFMFQFQSYAYTFINRFMSPMSQKLRQGVDVQSMTTMAILLMTANATMFVKHRMNGKELTDMTTENYIYDMMDRSGFFTYMTPWFDGFLKLTSPEMAKMGLNFTGTRSRFSSKDWYSSLFGVNMRVISSDLPNIFHGLTDADSQKLGQSLLRWVPMNQWMRFVGHSLGEEGSDVVNFGFLE